jgi:hypothetical protein
MTKLGGLVDRDEDWAGQVLSPCRAVGQAAGAVEETSRSAEARVGTALELCRYYDLVATFRLITSFFNGQGRSASRQLAGVQS